MFKYKKILLINFGGIGDEILFLPVISALKELCPDSNITLCLESRSRAFLQLTDLVDSYFFADIKTKNKYIEMLKLYFRALFGHYDLVISSGSNPLISLLLFLTGIKTRIGYKCSNLSNKLLTHAVELNKNQYAANMYFDLVLSLDNIEYRLPHINIETDEKYHNSVLIHPGVSKISIAKKITKTISPEKWAELIVLLLNNGKNVYLVGGPDDGDCILQIEKELECIENKANFFDLYGQTKNILDLAKLIKKSEVLICSDSAPMHIGVATNTKTIAIFGPTDDLKLIPESPNFIAVKNDTPCRPCLWDKRQQTCEKLDCLNIDLTKILNLV